jgi:hypothetical protein
MSKRGPLSKIEKFYIENNCDVDLDVLSSDLDRAKSVVKAYASKCQKKKKNTEDTKQKKEPTHLASQIPSSRGSTVMTENGSTISDDFRKKSQFLGKRSECTTSIRR